MKKAGGLAIIGTERHESRRVDRQLRGRAGRQGDPGSSVFYVSFEDQLMRLFVTDRVMRMLDRFGLQEGEMIESKMINNAIENAQKRVEENNFGIRKRLLEYDDVMNKQRTYIYSRRHHALLGERIGVDINNMFWDVIENLINTYDAPTDYEDLSLEVFKILAIEMPFTAEEFRSRPKEELIEDLHGAAMEAFERNNARIVEIANPVVKNWVEGHGAEGKIMVPMTDGKRVFYLRVDLKEAFESESASIVKEWEKSVLLVSIDELWKEHLRELDQLRQSVQNASYEQKDPLVIYKVESFHLFEQMLNNLNVKVASALLRGHIYIPTQQPAADPAQRPAPEVQREMPESAQPKANYQTSREGLPGESETRAAASARQGEQQRPQPAKAAPRVGRNDPCPCGSGKKFKNCHGRNL